MYIMWRDKLEKAIGVVGSDVDIDVYEDCLDLWAPDGISASVPLTKLVDLKQVRRQHYNDVHLGVLETIPRGTDTTGQIVVLRERPHDFGFGLELEVQAIYRYMVMDERTSVR